MRAIDLKQGMYITATAVNGEYMEKRTGRPLCTGEPLQVLEVSLPFVAIKDACGMTCAMDTRLLTFTRVSKAYAKCFMGKCKNHPPDKKPKQLPPWTASGPFPDLASAMGSLLDKDSHITAVTGQGPRPDATKLPCPRCKQAAMEWSSSSTVTCGNCGLVANYME
jgi:hypothetical protein